MAGYRLPGQTAPEKLVLIVRGTDVTHDAWGDIKEAFEDLQVLKQKPCPGTPPRRRAWPAARCWACASSMAWAAMASAYAPSCASAWPTRPPAPRSW
ncbi:hypothetical protein ACRAWD_26875 [Caulobacter segnis]